MASIEEIRKILIADQEYEISLKRFDEDVDPEYGATYHGFFIHINGGGLSVAARKYDDEREMLIDDGLQENDIASISILRGITKQLFGTDKLKLRTTSNPPYKDV